MRRNSFEGTVLHAEARAREVEAKLLEWRRLYPGITGNKPPIEPAMPRPGIGVSSQHPLDPEYYIKAFREIQSWPDMLNREHKGVYGGAVAAMEFDGDLVFGMNSHAPTYQGSDFAEAMTYRAILIARYPGRMSTVLTGRRPNDALLHAESTILLRALVKTKDRTLAGRSIKVSVDMDMCPSCIKVLPYLGLELGNPRVTYVNTRTGERRTMQDGRWIAGGR